MECKILVKIPGSVLDSALVLRGKEGDIVGEKLSNVSDLVKIEPKHANSKIKFLSRKIKNQTSAIFAGIFLRVFFLEFLAR